MLAHGGGAAIQVRPAAAAAKRAGKLDVAASLVEITEAAERLWTASEAVEAKAK
jgi:hypothetical protein